MNPIWCGVKTGVHEQSAFFSFPTLPGSFGAAATPAASPPGQSMPTNPNGTPVQQGIDVKAEVARIEGNITLFYAGITAAAIGLGVTSCLFVRSILKPAKGFHGGSSDGDMDSEEEDDSEDESDDS